MKKYVSISGAEDQHLWRSLTMLLAGAWALRTGTGAGAEVETGVSTLGRLNQHNEITVPQHLGYWGLLKLMLLLSNIWRLYLFEHSIGS